MTIYDIVVKVLITRQSYTDWRFNQSEKALPMKIMNNIVPLLGLAVMTGLFFLVLGLVVLTLLVPAISGELELGPTLATFAAIGLLVKFTTLFRQEWKSLMVNIGST